MLRPCLATTFCLLSACYLSTDSGGLAVQQLDCLLSVNTGSLPDGCTKIEGSELGQPQTLTAGGVTLEITSWITKDGEPNEYVGFVYTAPEGAFIAIKAGGESYVEDGDGTWVHPAGVGGSEASAISNIVVCEKEPVDPCAEEEEPPPVDDGGGEDPGDGDGDGDGGDGDLGGVDEGGDQACTSHEECDTGICLNGLCITI